MNSIIKKLLDDNLIDKEKLLLENYNSIGLSCDQVILIIKLLKLKKSCTINLISKEFNITKPNAEIMINELLKSKFIKINYVNKEMIFTFDLIWDKLISLYFIPTVDTPAEEKANWFANRLNINMKPIIKKTIISWIDDGGWNRMLSLIQGLAKIHADNFLEWKTIKKLYESEAPSKATRTAKLKKLQEANWLLD